METILATVAAALAAGLATGLIVLWTRQRALRIELAGAQTRIEAGRGALADAERDGAVARARLDRAAADLSQARAEADALRAEAATARQGQVEAETQSRLDRQALQEVERRLKDWEEAKAATLTHAKAAVLETASELSSKLLADHKKESEQAKKETEERIRKTTESLTRDFDHVAKSVKSLADQVGVNQQHVETVRRALSNPGGAGYFAEIGLENTLKAFGLERNRDFVLQQTVVDGEQGARKKPDAIVFLPHDSVLVIDSKASKFLLELAEAEGTDDEEAAHASLARTMNQHLRDLAGKDYAGAVMESYRAAGRGKDIRRVMNVMYLPNDGALEKLRRADPEFDRKAARARIQLAGPTVLSSLISFARMEIDLGRQAENQEKIIEAGAALLESVAIMVEHAEGVGRGLKGAVNSFVALAASTNKRLLPRTRALEELGVRPAKNKRLPRNVAAFQVIDHGVIEGEAEEVSPADKARDTDLNIPRLEPRPH